MQISVVFPAYNEQDNIVQAMHQAVATLGGLFKTFEIIIVDDASKDGTGETAEALAREFPEIHVLHNARNIGAGASVLKGFAAARGELVTHNAMDSPFDLRDLAKLLPLLREADIVVAVRTDHECYTLYRKLMSVVYLTLLHCLFDLKLRDYTFIQLYRQTLLGAVKVEARSAGFVTPEMMIRAHDLGYRIKEIEIEYHRRQRGRATSGHPKVIIASIRDMLRFWWKRTWARILGRSPSEIREKTPV